MGVVNRGPEPAPEWNMDCNGQVGKGSGRGNNQDRKTLERVARLRVFKRAQQQAAEQEIASQHEGKRNLSAQKCPGSSGDISKVDDAEQHGRGGR